MTERFDEVARHHAEHREREVDARIRDHHVRVDRTLSGEGLGSKYFGSRLDGPDEEPFARRRFLRHDPGAVASEVDSFATYGVGASTPTDFERRKRLALATVDRYLLPSAFREEAYEAVLDVTFPDGSPRGTLFGNLAVQSARSRLSDLAASIRDRTGGPDVEPAAKGSREDESGAARGATPRSRSSSVDATSARSVLGADGTDALVLTGLETLAEWSAHWLGFSEERFDQYREWLVEDVEGSNFPPVIRGELRDGLDDLTYGHPSTPARVRALAAQVRRLDAACE